MKVRKAVFPVAGLGTRFLPATKALPKEMLPVVDKPLIQYAVEEALAAGIEQLIFITGSGKTAIENHFDRSCDLEQTLVNRNKQDLLAQMETLIPESGTIVYTRQHTPLGLGHAIWCARDIIGKEPFAVLLADDLIKAEKPVLAQMIEQYQTTLASILAVMEVDPSETNKYGILDAEDHGDDRIRVLGMEEKPLPEKAKTNLAIIGRYILTPEIFDFLGQKKLGAGGEIQLTDAMAQLLRQQPFFAVRFKGTRFDCGDKAGFQMANLVYALDRPDLSEQLLPFIRSLLSSS